ncbi:MAG: hypothetical protein JXB10_13235 [Pirellulales bacterium]|nr:hypothetical protein [Pirellulales bacterium]
MRGPGGMGMMGPGGMFGGQGMNFMLLRNEKVQKELEIVPEQKEKLQALSKEMRGNRPDFGALQDLSPEERREKMEENRKKMQKAMEDAQAKIKEILLPNQLERLNQIRLQSLGTMVLMDPEVQKELKFTKEQKDKMKAIGEEMRKQTRELMQGVSPDEWQEVGKKMQQMQKQTNEKLMEVLTADQKTALEKMKGEKFDVESLRPSGPPPRRGRNRDRGNRPPPTVD